MKQRLFATLLLATLGLIVGCNKQPPTKAQDAPEYAKQMQSGDTSGAAGKYATQYGQSAGAMRGGGPGGMQGGMQRGYGQPGGMQGGYGQGR